MVPAPPITRPTTRKIASWMVNWVSEANGAFIISIVPAMPPNAALDTERQHLVDRQVDAAHRGTRLVVAHRDQRTPRTALDEVAGQHEQDHRHHHQDRVDPQRRGEAPGVVERHPRRWVHPRLATRRLLPVRAAGEAAVLEHQRGEDERQRQRDDRQVQPADAQRRQADDAAEQEARRGRHRDRGEEAPVVIGDEDDRRVGAEADERRVTERQLSGVADHQVQPEDRHRVSRSPSLSWVTRNAWSIEPNVRRRRRGRRTTGR